MFQNRLARRVLFAAVGLGLLGAAIVPATVDGREPNLPQPPRDSAREVASREQNQEIPMKATGIVAELQTNKHGDVDGLLLKDGTEIKFPPHQGEDLEAFVKAGDEVRVVGRRHETPDGDIHLHADKVTLTATGKSLERDEPVGPPPPKPGKAGRHGPKDAVPPHEQILAELRSLRKLIESQQK